MSLTDPSTDLRPKFAMQKWLFNILLTFIECDKKDILY